MVLPGIISRCRSNVIQLSDTKQRIYEFDRQVIRKSKDKKDLNDIREAAKNFYKDYNMPTDKKIFAALMEMFYKNIPKEFQPDIFRYRYEKNSKTNFNRIC